MAHPPFRAGSLLSRRYRLRAPLGSGGSGVAWLADDLVFEREVAIKLIDDPSWQGRLRSEFWAVQGLVHPNLVRALDYEVDFERGVATDYLVYEVVPGQTLERYAQGRSFSELEIVLRDLLAGLGFLHALGVSHGDVKATNVVVSGDGRGVLIDFGCARRFGPVVGTIAGTPGYVPPELGPGGSVDGRNDLFALGVTFDRLLPQLTTSPEAVTRRLLRRLHASDVAQRPATATEVLELLGDPRAVQLAPAGRSTELLGRRDEVGAFRNALREWLNEAGTPLLQLYWGPSGVGKSRLLQHLEWDLQGQVRVIEGAVSLQGAVREMVARESGRHVSTLEQMLASVDSVATRGRCVFLLDDVHALDPLQAQWLCALVRFASVSKSFGLLLASHTPLDVEQSALAQVELQPLDYADVGRWCVAAGQESSKEQVFEQSAGYPGEVEALLSRRATPLAPQVIAALSESQRRALVRLVVSQGRLAIDDGDDAQVMAELFARGWVRARSGGFELLHEGQRRRLEALLPEPLLLSGHAEAAAALERTDTPSLPRLAWHWLGSGDRMRAEQALLRRSDTDRQWVPVSERLLQSSRSTAVLLACARVFQSAGDLKRALGAAGRALRVARTGLERATARLEAARILLRLGRAARAVRALGEEVPDASVAAQANLVRARACIQTGEYDRASALTTDERPLPSEQQLLRSEVRGTALIYSGDSLGGRQLLERVAEQLTQRKQHEARARVESLIAIAAFRDGDLARARQGYAHSLRLAEEHGLPDLLASAALNWATLCQQLGDWGAALSGYERALTLALALGRGSTEQRAAFNLGNLFVQVGAFDRAAQQLDRAEQSAQAAKNMPVLAAVAQVRGELHGLAGGIEAARDAFAQAERLQQGARSARERLELSVQRLLVEARVDADSELVDELERQLQQSRELAPDLDAWVGIALGRTRLARGDSEAALDAARRALASARLADVPHFCAASEALLFEVQQRRGDQSAAQLHREAALASYGKLVNSLPSAYRDVFWAHPERRALQREAVVDARRGPRPIALDSQPTSDERPRLLRFLAINRRINSQLDTSAVLEAALDAAIELSHAERGFVLLRQPGASIEVRARRRIHPESGLLGEADFSRSIAERVLSTQTPVITVDAGSDVRFHGEASVAALALKSVACVPFRSQRGIQGALYVDNRLAVGRFSSADTELLLAFGDQVAIALDNAELHAEVVVQRQQLEAAKQQLERLLRSRERDIERLEIRLDHQQAALERRFDYSQIKGRGPAMQRVFALLDRIIDTDVTVLIQGESGSGKELVARAIHFQSRRKRLPFIAINCGALPEQLLESELFGHRKGAFSGANQDKVGLLVAAGGGSVFLDEIGELPLPLQVKLLRALQEREVLPLGATRPVPVAARISSATHKDLVAEVERGRFREDLYFRLAVIQVQLPALRDRLEDLPELVAALLERIAHDLSRPIPQLTRGAMAALSAHRWPGNVRELQNVLTKAALLCDGTIGVEHLQLSLPRPRPYRPKNRDEFEQGEVDRILEALRASRWNVARVSKDLGIPRNTLYRKLAKYGIARPE